MSFDTSIQLATKNEKMRITDESIQPTPSYVHASAHVRAEYSALSVRSAGGDVGVESKAVTA
jgi:hypothetical protein